MRAVLATMIVACLSLPASARPHRHHVNPMVRGLGLGFAHMLKSGDQAAYSGPAAMPDYGYQDSLHPITRRWSYRRGPLHAVARFVRHIAYDIGQIVGHPAGCPHTEFCGCGAAVHIFGHAVRELYLAANWLRFPRAAPAPGMAAVFGRHHVAVIERVNEDGSAILYDANSGHHLTRIHRASLDGAVIVNPHGAKS